MNRYCDAMYFFKLKFLEGGVGNFADMKKIAIALTKIIFKNLIKVKKITRKV